MPKNLLLNIVLVLLFNMAYAQIPTLTGKGSIDIIYGSEHKDWYEANYNACQIDETTINTFPQIDDTDLKIVVVMGVWCSDSKIHVPHFFRILDYWHVKPKTEVYFVDRSKTTKAKGFKKLNIEYIPTFIFFNKNNKEIGRIVEQPYKTLEKDMVEILKQFSN
jgi:ribosome-binding factor A